MEKILLKGLGRSFSMIEEMERVLRQRRVQCHFLRPINVQVEGTIWYSRSPLWQDK